jgi:phage terminase large subunit GpA-like protein
MAKPRSAARVLEDGKQREIMRQHNAGLEAEKAAAAGKKPGLRGNSTRGRRKTAQISEVEIKIIQEAASAAIGQDANIPADIKDLALAAASPPGAGKIKRDRPMWDGFRSVFVQLPDMTVSEWADLYRILPRTGSAAPGPWRTARTPYLKAIMDDLSPQTRVREVVFCKGSQIGAPLALDTPVLTVQGWKTIGAVEVGDRVYDENGKPRFVTGLSDVFTGRDCFAVSFSDGTVIVSDGEHRWPVQLGRNRRQVIRRTAELMPYLDAGHHASVPLVNPPRAYRDRDELPRRRRMVSVRPVASVPVRCIQTESPSHLFLVGLTMIPTHNTEAGTNWILYAMDVTPGPFLAVQPTEGTATRWSKQRVGPSLEACAQLKGKVKRASGNTAGSSILQKDYPGGTLVISGANAPAALASMPIGNVYADEIDRYPLDVGEEGDPLDLIRQRTATYPRAKIFYTSTPTLLMSSKIWALYQQSDQRVLEVPCPHCGELQEIRFENLRWPRGSPEEVALYCVACTKAIPELHKTWMLANASWIARKPGHWRHGYHLSSLYSPLGWLSWMVIARRFEECGTDVEKKKSFTNTILGLPWEESGETIAAEFLERRKEQYAGQVPDRVLLLTLAVDVQAARLEIEVCGWGRDEESWGIEYRTILGDPAELVGPEPGTPSVWDQLEEYRKQVWRRADGREMRVACVTIDSGGHYTDTVYEYTRPRERQRVFSVKGSSIAERAILTKPTRNTRNRAALFVVGVDKAKELIYSRLRLEGSGPGSCHFPSDSYSGYDAAYYAGLTSEKRVIKHLHGYPVLRWEKPRDARNEPLDLRVYGTAAIRILKPAWDILEARMAGVTAPPIRVESTPVPVPQAIVAAAQAPRRTPRPRRPDGIFTD